MDVKKQGLKDLSKLKNQIYHCLEKYPDTRNSDILLMTTIWQEFYSEYIDDRKIKLDALFVLPREDSVKRMRAMLTKKNLFLPTNLEVAKKRKIKEEVWRESLGFNPELREV